MPDWSIAESSEKSQPAKKQTGNDGINIFIRIKSADERLPGIWLFSVIVTIILVGEKSVAAVKADSIRDYAFFSEMVIQLPKKRPHWALKQ
jgi:hypothetical protein